MFVQLVPQVVSPVAHVAVHWPLEQKGVAVVQIVPHIPQLAASLLVLVQVAPQSEVPAPHELPPPPAPAGFKVVEGRQAELKASEVDTPRSHAKRRFMRGGVLMLYRAGASETAP